jgi:4-hydroxybenzoyl-CoA thioesterase
MFTSAYSRMIEFGDCDPARIVWNPRFFGMADHGVTCLFADAFGRPAGETFLLYGIAGLPLVHTEASFRKAVFWEDEVRVETTVMKIGRSSLSLGHRVIAKGEVCAEISGVRVWAVAAPGRPGEIMAAPIPDAVREALSAPGPANQNHYRDNPKAG